MSGAISLFHAILSHYAYSRDNVERWNMKQYKPQKTGLPSRFVVVILHSL